MADTETDAAPEGGELDRETSDGKAGDKGKPPAKSASGFKGFIKSHRDEVLVISAVVGLLLAWLTLHKTNQGGTAGASDTTTGATGSTVPTSAYGGSGSGSVAGYSGSADYGLQSLLQNLGTSVQQLDTTLAAQVPATGTTAAPVPAVPQFQFGAAAAGDKYIVNYDQNKIYQLQGSGQLLQLNANQWSAVDPGIKSAKNPNGYTVVGKQH